MIGFDKASGRDWTAIMTGPVNGQGFPAGNVKLVRIESHPVYVTFWRWLTRRPKYFNVTSHFSIEPEKCEHERLNDHGDACLDCGMVYCDDGWQ